MGGIRRLFVLIVAVSAVWCMGVAEAKTLDEELSDIDSLRDGTSAPFQEAEKRTRALLQQYTAPEEQGRIYFELAVVYAQSGPDPEGTIRNAKAALDRPLDPVKRLLLYTWWGDAIQVANRGVKGDALAVARREAVKPYLAGLKETIEKGIPKDKPAPVVARFETFDGDISTKELRRLKAQSDAQAAAQNLASFQTEMISHRDILVKQIVDLYGRHPFATEELERSARETLGDHWLVDELVGKTRDAIAARVSKSTPSGGR